MYTWGGIYGIPKCILYSSLQIKDKRIGEGGASRVQTIFLNFSDSLHAPFFNENRLPRSTCHGACL